MIDSAQFEQDGFAIEPLLSVAETQRLITLLEQHVQPDSRRGGVRDVMDSVPELQAVAADARVRAIVEEILGEDAFPVRATFFDKTPDANWKVPWHQDVTIAVVEREESEGYGPWSVKQDVVHVQPPTEVLARMVTVRVHLDPCPAENGALRVIPGTHRLGRIDQNLVSNYMREDDAVFCAADSGAALVMRPLLLHASSASMHPGHRRVLHFDFAMGELAGNLHWRLR